MAFFDQIGKRLSDAGQTVARQTRNLADVAQLNVTIAERQREINQLYQAIGQTCFERYQNEETSVFQTQFAQIKALLEEIAQCQEKINQIKGIIPCPSCGADIPVQAQFCNVCGAKIEQAPAAQETADAAVCPSCGVSVSPEDLYCNHCGAKL